MDPEVVRHGFSMTRTIEKQKEFYDQMVASGRMNTTGKGHKANSKERKGATREPILRGYKDPLQHIFPLHCYINHLKYLESFIITFNSRDAWPNNFPVRRAGKRMTPEQKDRIEMEENIMKTCALDDEGLGMILDAADRTGAGVSCDIFTFFLAHFEIKLCLRI